MRNTLMLLICCALLGSLSTMSQTITCNDGERTFVVNVDTDANTMSFNYSYDGDIALFGDLIPEFKNDIPSVSTYNHDLRLLDGYRYYEMMAYMLRPVWVEEHIEYYPTRSGGIEYLVPEHYENTVIKLLNIMLKGIEGGYVFNHLEGGDFGFTMDHPIVPGAPCTIQ